MGKRFWIVVGAMVSVVAVLAIARRHDESRARIVPDVPRQEAIAAVAHAKDPAALDAALEPLRAEARDDFARLIPQLVYVLMHARDDREAMVAGVIVDRLRITPAQLRAALEPYRQSSDPLLRAQVLNLLGEEDAPPASP